MFKKFNLIGALLISGMVQAASVYTPAELRSMVNSGNPPQQGEPSSQSKPMDYASCVTAVELTVAAVSPHYPSVSQPYPIQTLLDTDMAFMEKIWTNNAAVILTCADGKLIITSSPYL
ncbi:MAG: hypothetical protein MN733_17175 [Nitrososphaera sp.]|nr:hypothetical protein [Nitrososphaera sp.]